MSWLYSQALVAEYSAANYSGGAPCVPSSANPTPQAYLPSDRMTDFSRPSRFGMTFAPLTVSLGADVLTWFLAVSRARTSAPPARVPESTAHAPACGEKWRELSMRFDPDTRLWRTHRCLWDEVLSESSVSLPRWGLMRGGVLSAPVTSARPTSANEFGLWPTPTASMGGQESAGATGRKLITQVGGQLNPTWVEWLMGWPLGWTDLQPWATDKYRHARQRHGGC